MHDGMQYDPIQGQGHGPLKVGNLAIFKGYLLFPQSTIFSRVSKVWIYCLRLRIYPPMIKLAASNFARRFIGGQGRECHIFVNFGWGLGFGVCGYPSVPFTDGLVMYVCIYLPSRERWQILGHEGSFERGEVLLHSVRRRATPVHRWSVCVRPDQDHLVHAASYLRVRPGRRKISASEYRHVDPHSGPTDHSLPPPCRLNALVRPR